MNIKTFFNILNLKLIILFLYLKFLINNNNYLKLNKINKNIYIFLII